MNREPLGLEDFVRQRMRVEIAERSAYETFPSVGRIKLDAMENPYIWPAAIQKKWLLTLREIELNRYPDSTGRELCADIRSWGCLSDSESILLGNGSDELIQMIVMALGGFDRPVLAPEPTFGMYKFIAEATGCPFIGVPLTENFLLDRDRLLREIDEHDPSCIFLAYPNNPTGNLFDFETINAVIKRANGLVIVDEAYYPYSGKTFIKELQEHDHLAILRTFSKLGLAGLRLGFLAGPHPWLAEINKVRLPYNISVLTQASARFALSQDLWFQKQAGKICAERARLYNDLQSLPGIKVYPSDANFFLLRLLKDNADKVTDRLFERKIVIKNLNGQHENLQECLRVTIGTPAENDKFLEELSAVLTP
jgi:histidinol-phosphate aminotransferase